MDQRELIHSVISYAQHAQREVENMPAGVLSANANFEMELAYNALEDCIQHCQGIFGPSQFNTNRRRRDIES